MEDKQCIFDTNINSLQNYFYIFTTIYLPEIDITLRDTKNARKAIGKVFFQTNWPHEIERPIALHKKWSFPLGIFSVNVTKYAVSCGFGHIYLGNSKWKTSLVQCWESCQACMMELLDCCKKESHSRCFTWSWIHLQDS